MATYKTTVAFEVQCEECDVSSAIVYATSHIAARRKGASILDSDMYYVRSCKRAPEFDHLHPHGPSNYQLWQSGWSFTCRICDDWAAEDSYGEYDGRHFYCEYCRDQVYTWHGHEISGLQSAFYGDNLRGELPIVLTPGTYLADQTPYVWREVV